MGDQVAMLASLQWGFYTGAVSKSGFCVVSYWGVIKLCELRTLQQCCVGVRVIVIMVFFPLTREDMCEDFEKVLSRNSMN